jgi:hypothetical protein
MSVKLQHGKGSAHQPTKIVDAFHASEGYEAHCRFMHQTAASLWERLRAHLPPTLCWWEAVWGFPCDATTRNRRISS